MKNIRVFLSETFQLLEVKFSIYLNRRVFVLYILRSIIGSHGSYNLGMTFLHQLVFKL